VGRQASDRSLCRPALLWDVRALRALDDPAADSFINAFGTPREEPDIAARSTHPLLLAAGIVILERQGEAHKAEGLYERLSGGPWRDLLGSCLRAWAPSGDRESIEDARGRVNNMRDRDLRPRVLAKLAGVALDKNETELGIALLQEAVDRAPRPSRLVWALEIVRANITGEFPSISSARGLPNDPLVDQDWIEGEASAGLREQTSETLSQHAQSPWSSTVRIGRTAVDRALAAERQATWAGALWLRDDLRKQAGAQIMLTGTSTAEQLTYGLMMWLVGGGANRKPIANWLEPKLRSADLTQLIGYLVEGGDPSGRREIATVDVCLTWWDCLSSPLVALVLDAFTPSIGTHPHQADVRLLWARLAQCGHDSWTNAFLRLEPEAKAAVAALMDARTIELLPDEVVSAIDSAMVELPERELTISSNPLLVKLAAAKRTGTELPDIALEELGPADLLEIAEYSRESVSDEYLVAAAEMLSNQIEQSIADARAGRFGFGATRPEALIGEYIVLLGLKGLRYVPVLAKAVMSPFYGGEARLAAFAALATVELEIGLPDNTIALIRDAPVEAPAADFLAIGSEVLQAGKLLALFDHLTSEDEAVLIALARSDDARVREVTINAAGLAYRAAEEARPPLESTLASALFDPESGVIARGLEELRRRQPSELNLMVERRLKTLVTAYSRPVRAGAVRLARTLLELETDSALEKVVELARHDKSWQVRRAVREELDQLT
jgi:hypothetical protein